METNKITRWLNKLIKQVKYSKWLVKNEHTLLMMRGVKIYSSSFFFIFAVDYKGNIKVTANQSQRDSKGFTANCKIYASSRGVNMLKALRRAKPLSQRELCSFPQETKRSNRFIYPLPLIKRW